MDGGDVLGDLNSLFPTAPVAPKVQESIPAAELSLDERILYDAIGTEEAHINDITTLSGLTSATVNATLMRLEMKRLIRALPGRRYVRMV
jgi:DNA processing protein